jgi:molybdenum cofactor biosynthesis enzyme MoaA
MPKEVFGSDYQFLERSQILTFEEIARLARIFVGHGVRKIRLTGGEPLVRRDLYRLVAMLSSISNLELTLTTNGSLLARQARAWISLTQGARPSARRRCGLRFVKAVSLPRCRQSALPRSAS